MIDKYLNQLHHVVAISLKSGYLKWHIWPINLAHRSYAGGGSQFQNLKELIYIDELDNEKPIYK